MTIHTASDMAGHASEPFSNHIVDIGQLPNADDVRWQPLSPKYRISLFFDSLIRIAIATAIIVAIEGFVVGADRFRSLDIPTIDPTWLFIVLGLIALAFLVLPQLAFNFRRYAIRERDVQYRTGFWRRRSVAVPINRIQHVEIVTGPIDRLLGLAQLQLFTAGSASSDLSLAGLDKQTAQSLRLFLLRTTATAP